MSAVTDNPHGVDWTPIREVGKAEVSIDRYVSEDYFEREREHIWRRLWLMVGREADVSEPGDYFTFYLHTLSVLAIVVHGKDGQLNKWGRS